MDLGEDGEWQSALVSRPDSTTADLRDVALGLGHWEQPERDELAQALVAHPNFGPGEAQACIRQLHTEWWGDDPVECHAGWDALKRAMLGEVDEPGDS